MASKPIKLYDFSDCPAELQDFLQYLTTVRNLSSNTVNGYSLDLRTFFRYLALQNQNAEFDSDTFSQLPIADISLPQLRAVNSKQIYDYLFFLTRQLTNTPKTRARKLSSLKSFFKYLTTKAHLLKDDPAKTIEIPSLKKSLPKYLTLEESVELLENVSSDFPERDYCILTLFLNCGMRLSELIGIDVGDVKENTIRILGKGNKERLVYLNDSSRASLDQYLAARQQLPVIKDKNALFLSRRLGKRLSARRVEQIVAASLQAAGLSGRGFSPHKLRHTAATLMYQYGNVDMLALKEILGHEHVTTTEIYTHISNTQLQEAVQSSPLARLKPKSASKKNAQKTPQNAVEDEAEK